MKLLQAIFLSFVSLVVVAQNQPPSLSTDEQLAAQFFSEGDFERAAALYEELFEKDPSPLIYNNYLQSLLELEKFRKAERVVNSQIKNNPGRARFEVDLGYVHTLAGDTRKAKKQMEGLIRDLPNHPPAVTDLANSFLFRDFTDYALQTYNKGRNMLGDTYPFNLQFADIYQRKGNFEKMMSEYVELAILDESYLEQVQGLLQDAINDDPEFEKTDALRRVLLQGSQKNPGQTLYAELLIWLSIQQKDFEMAFRQARALDRRLMQEGRLVLEIAKLSASNNRFSVARESYEYVIGLGDLNPHFLEATVGLLNAKYNQATSDYNTDYDLLHEVEVEYEQTIEQTGLRAQTVSLVRNLAHLKAFYLNNTEEASDLLQSVIDMPNISNRVKGECRVELADILLLKGELWDAHLLYAQVDKSFRDDPLAHEARYKNARLSFYMGEFKWAKAQLDVLKAATSRLMANDAMALSLLIQDNLEEDGTSEPLQLFAEAEKHIFMNNFEPALAVLDTIEQLYAAHQIMDDVMMTRANIYLRTGQFDDADSVFASVVSSFPRGLHAADALFRRALLQEQVFENHDLAMELYGKIMTDYPGSLRNNDARTRFRYLRGDLNEEELFFYGL